MEDLVGEVARLQLMLRSFSPLFPTDCTATHAFVRHDYPFEYLTSFEDWVEIRRVEGRTEYVEGRMRSILDAYCPDRIIVVEAGKELSAIRRGFLNELLAESS